MICWPYPGDTPLQRARRVAVAYRQHLKVANPGVCTALDDMATSFGEAWVCEHPVTVPEDQLLTTAEAADLAGVAVKTVRQWRHRGIVDNGGRRWLRPASVSDRGWPLFLTAEILAFAAATRRRRLHGRAA